MKYDPQVLESKWQKFWLENQTFYADVDPSKPKYYVLDMFPYPSGAGLHVGHLMGYTATDVVARYKWAKGYQVLHPMGWDSFGLPAEQYAVRTGTHPAITTAENIKNFKRQLQALGYAYDWDKELATSDPNYYKWTQWLFTKLYEKGLAYQAQMLVNYCPALGTVLANEEVEEGRSKEGGHPVERRPLKQWILKITAYADRLLEDLEMLDWPEGLKKLQRNWIGKSQGCQITFNVIDTSHDLTVFTTAPETLFGVSYLVLSPEHPLVGILTQPDFQEAMRHYQHEVAAKSDLERTELSKHKTGLFTGSYARHPITGQALPIWVADYVLMGYGTGVVMGVPAHDERDGDFARHYQLPVLPVIDDDGRMIESDHAKISLNGLDRKEASHKISDWLETFGKGKKTTQYKLRDWLFSRQRYWGEPFPLLYLEDGSTRTLDLDELPLLPPDVLDYKPSQTGESPIARVKEWVHTVDKKTGLKATRETDTMPQWAGSCWYYLRFIDPHNDKACWDAQKEKYWLPVDLYVGGAEHAVLHLLYARFWHKVFYDCQLVHGKEPFQKLCNQGLVVARSYQKSSGAYVPPEEVIGQDGVYKHWETGEVLRSQIEKMSKSKLNGVSPDEILEEFGADALRLYALFLGPLDKEKVWNTESVAGCRRFLNRFYELCTHAKIVQEPDYESEKLAHRLVHGVEQDLEKLQFNTAIAKHMEFINAMNLLPQSSQKALEMAIIALAPLAPHIAEELWAHLGHAPSVVRQAWPKVNPAFLVDEQVTYVIQINGKLRGRLDLPKDKSQEEILALATQEASVNRHLKGPIAKVVFVPNKLLNIVLEG
jgi:leucyl-tRNA synthetase